MKTRKEKIQDLLFRLTPLKRQEVLQDTFKSLDESLLSLSEKFKKTLVTEVMDAFDDDIKKVEARVINPKPLIESLEKKVKIESKQQRDDILKTVQELRDVITSFDTKNSKTLQSIIKDIEALDDGAESTNNSNIAKFESIEKNIQDVVDDIKHSIVDETSQLRDDIDALKTSLEKTGKRGDVTYKELKEYVDKLYENVESLSNRVPTSWGGSSRSIYYNAAVLSNKYSDINLIGSGVTISASDNNTTKMVDVTLSLTAASVRSLFSATSPIVYDSSSGNFSWDFSVANTWIGQQTISTSDLKFSSGIGASYLDTGSTITIRTSNNAGGYLIDSTAATNGAGFRLLPFGNDIYFQNAYTNGQMNFTGLNGVNLAGQINFKTSNNVSIGGSGTASKLGVYGNISVGTGTFATAAPSNGALIQGNVIVGDGTSAPQIFFNYGDGGDFTGQLNGTSMMSFGFNNHGDFGGTNGAASGREFYVYDRQLSTYRFSINGSGDMYLGSDSSSWDFKFIRTTTTPAYISLGSSYSSSAGSDLKLRIYESGGSVYGIGISAAQLDYAVPSGAAHVTYVNGTEKFRINGTGFGFFSATPIAKPTVSGSKGANAALASLLTALANYGLITDSTT